MEDYLGILLLIANVMLLILTSRKINRLILLKQEYSIIERNITAMIKENSDIVELILEELENKLKETNLLRQQNAADQSFPDLIKMYKKGVPVREIAEKIGMSQDEIKLKLNLYKRNTEEKAINC